MCGLQTLIVDRQYHISPAAVVHRPRRLLEWCSEFRITYTFSPNFLLAQIIQDAKRTPFDSSTKLESLASIISGGESVPVGTAVAFADLLEESGARRNALRAGFGMTETAVYPYLLFITVRTNNR
jgi:acyl-CoA synthetase (AMP-forming)/AMP-acid ligase II